MDGPTDGWTGGRTDEYMEGWMDGWIDRLSDIYIPSVARKGSIHSAGMKKQITLIIFNALLFTYCYLIHIS